MAVQITKFKHKYGKLNIDTNECQLMKGDGEERVGYSNRSFRITDRLKGWPRQQALWLQGLQLEAGAGLNL